MKKTFFTTTAIVCCFIVIIVVINSLDGKWTGTLKTPDGNEIPLTYNLKVDSGKVKGTAESPQGTVPIDNGKITGNDFSFKVTVDGNDYQHTGKFYDAADSVGMDIDFNGMKLHTTLKRVVK
ncbi:MAG: hypothetical protein JWP44_1821 [Mucilaginibacter sp.]|nr:hypothetical protein [Mucilaginibacter sp.]